MTCNGAFFVPDPYLFQPTKVHNMHWQKGCALYSTSNLYPFFP